MQVSIQPVTFFPNQAVSLRIEGVKVRDLGNNGCAMIICAFLDSGGNSLSSSVVEMSSTAYSLWGTDDTYVLDFAIQALGLTKA